MEPQLKRGFLDLCILAAVADEDSYGYQIIKDAPACLELSESTLYPILRRLAKQGALSEYSREHNGRRRKYYSITELGRQELDSFVGDAGSIQEIIAYVKRGAGK